VHDLAVIIVSTNSTDWLRPCLRTVFEKAGEARLDVVVASNEPSDGTPELVATEFPEARVVECENRGFAHGNNQAYTTTDARYVLFLNPDTEILDGTLGELLRALDERPTVGLIGVKQVTADGALFPTIRRFPNAIRALGEALWSERWPFHPGWSGERELDMALYEREVSCDWTSGSFMLARRDALLSAGIFDERSFLYAEEADLCLRIKRAGWDVRHLPLMTILHHVQKAGIDPRMTAQAAIARQHYARKHFSAVHRTAYIGALLLRYGLRSVAYRPGDHNQQRRAASLRAVRTLLGRIQPPFGASPKTAIEATTPGFRSKVAK
jgi:N-acetylglucosaminyl-diphospho-decaprenol L-rhamnosyltransferase